MKADFAILVRKPNGEHIRFSDRKLRHLKGVQKGGQNNVRRHKWTAETARKAALKAWKKRSKVTGRRQGIRFTKKPPTPDYQQWTVVKSLQKLRKQVTPDGTTIITWAPRAKIAHTRGAAPAHRNPDTH